MTLLARDKRKLPLWSGNVTSRGLAREDEPTQTFAPTSAVWELTLRCTSFCVHCGSRAGTPRSDELTTEECLDVADQLAALGVLEVSLIGGEAFLHPGFLDVVARLHKRRVRVAMATGGLGLTREMIDEAAKVGLESASVSIDGIGRTHDRLRGKRGAFESGMQAFALLREAGVYVGFNSQINRENLGEIDALANLTIEKDAAAWQVALTVAMGNAADRPELLLQPYDVLEVIPALAQAATKLREQGKLLYPGNNVGYFGPHEHALRGSTSCGHYGGCGAGRSTLGIEANGNVKGCPSLPSADWVGGNLREHRLATIWGRAHALRYTRTRTKAALWGFCGSCYYAESCMGGCTWTSHSLLGRPGNNPYCYHRADALMKSGERERIELVERPSGLPFDHGLYSLTLEPWCEPSLSPHQKN